MKKLLLTIVAFAMSTTIAFATGHFGGAALSGTGATSSSAAGGVSFGNGVGLSVQGSSAGAVNTTSVGAFSNGFGTHDSNIGASVFSAGGSYSTSAGVTAVSGNAIAGGTTFGLAAQGGIGAAYANGIAFDIANDADSVGVGIGFASVDAFAAQGSISGSTVTGNGTAFDGAFGIAGTNSVAGVHIDATPHLVTINEYSNVDTIAGGGSASGVTGTGIAGGAGGGLADGTAFTVGFGAVIATP